MGVLAAAAAVIAALHRLLAGHARHHLRRGDRRSLRLPQPLPRPQLAEPQARQAARVNGRLPLALAVLAAVAAAAAPNGGAVATKTVTLKLGDEFVVKGTHILCTAQISRSLVRGRRLVGCAFASSNGPVPKTYAVGIAVNGEVVLAKVKADGSPEIVSRRKPAVAGSAFAPRLYQLAPGDAVVLNESAIACATSRQQISAGKKTIVVSCFLLEAGKDKAKPNTYGIGITDGGAFVIHFDAKSKPTIVQSKKHGS